MSAGVATSAATRRRHTGRTSALRALVRLSTARPVGTIVVSVLGALAALSYAAHHIGFVTSGRDLLPQDQSYVRRDAEYSDDFPRLDQLVVAVESDDVGRAKAYARRLAAELHRDRDTFQRVTYRIDPRRFRGRELLYLAPADLADIRDELTDHQPFIAAFAAQPTLDRLVDGIRTEVVAAFVRSAFDLGLDAEAKPVDLGAARDVLEQVASRLDRPQPYRSPWSSLFAVDRGGENAGWFFSDDERLLFVLVEAKREHGSFTTYRDAIGPLRAAMARVGGELPDVRAGLTGAPVLDEDQMEAAFRDSKRATVLAFALTLGVLVVAFRQRGAPLLVLASLAASVCWSLGVVTLLVGHLSIFSVTFISIVVGLGTDYGVYLVFRYDEERRRGASPRAALETAAARSGPGMLSGALAAAGTFFVLLATDFPGIRELGAIAGMSILLAWVAMITLLPALIVAVGRSAGTRAGSASGPAPAVEAAARHPKVVLGLAATAAVLSVVALRTVRFDYNLLHLQAQGTESVDWEERILRSAGRSSFVALSTAASLDELAERVRAFEALDSVSEVESVLSLIPTDQAAKASAIADLAPLVAPIVVGPRQDVDAKRLASALGRLRQRLDLAVDEAPAGHDRDEVTALRDRAAALEQRLEHEDARVAATALAPLQDRLRADFARTIRHLKQNLHPTPITLADVPAPLRGKFVGRSGRFLMQIQPKVDIWDREGAERFVGELRTVDPDVTGTPVISFEATRSMERAYKEGTLYAVVLVALLTGLFVRSVRESLLAMVSLLLGTLWTVGLMALFGLPFNLGNVFGFPLILGAGAEFGLNVVLRYREGLGRDGPLVPRGTFSAVLVNGLTTVVGFGSLMTAAHRGIFGLGLLLTLGMVATLAASLIVLPVLLRWTEPRAATRVIERLPSRRPSRAAA